MSGNVKCSRYHIAANCFARKDIDGRYIESPAPKQPPAPRKELNVMRAKVAASAALNRLSANTAISDADYKAIQALLGQHR